jgi:hypothetical protein
MKAVLSGTLCMLALAVLAAPADSAKRTVPRGFYGTIFAGDVEAAPAGTQAQVWDRLAEAGVESVRVQLSWQVARAERSWPNYYWGRSDASVGPPAARGMSVMATVIATPEWAKQYPGVVQSPPRKPAEYAAFLRALVERYGPKGSYWAEHPELPKRPVRYWQIWNEPELSDHWWRKGAWGAAEAKRYGALLRASYRAVRKADPGAKVVLGGLTNMAWETLATLYRTGGVRGYFDVAAVHMFPGRWRNVGVIVKRFRSVLDANGDSRKPIWVTEMTWPAAEGRAGVPPWADTPYYRNFVTTEKGTANRLKGAYGLLGGRSFRRQNRLQRVHWFASATSFREDYIWNYSGLLEIANMRKTPAYDAYQASARKHQGCSKDAAGSCR